ncbi:MAG: type II toxin-antitoxin system RelE/ParE family toxin [Bacteroidota bacterium]
MELIVKGTFDRDISSYTNQYLLEQVQKSFENIKKAKSISQIQNLVKLSEYKIFYRIQIAADYRIGIIIRKDTVWAIRFGHRNTIYKYFP